jgi:uncharacterized protein (TIGR00730 family)
MQSICVFLGSNPGNRPEYRAAAVATGREIARRGMTTVYGGSNVGLMGALADAALAEGGKVVGIIPAALERKEISHTGLSELHVVGSMHERKALMAERADGFIALPGGLGTLEEICEVLTWAQLGFHKKPCGLLNVAGYYSPLAAFFDATVSEGFVREAHRDMLLWAEDPARMLDQFAVYRAPVVPKWIERPQTL